MEREFLLELVRQSLGECQAPRRLLVGLSGGADSVALLDLLTRLGHDCVASHCNFHLRGAESDRDMECAHRAALRCGAEWKVAHFDVPRRMAQTGESLEMACRSLRYDWWEELMDQGVAPALSVAHHRDDNVETLLLNLLRGSGVNGLKGMLPRRGRVVRPLLEASRAQIVDYCRSKGLEFVVDSTNLENDCRRNCLRNVILPELEREFPGAIAGIQRTLGCLRDGHALLHDLERRLRADYCLPDGSMDVARLLASEPNSRASLHMLVRERGLNMSQVEDIIRCAGASQSGRRFGQWMLERGVLRPLSSPSSSDESRKLAFKVCPRSDFKPDRSAMKLCVSPEAIDGEPCWELRPWRAGDRMEPYGMKGSRLLSDMMSDAKYDSARRLSQRVLTRNGVIVWAVGLRTSRHFPVGEGDYVEITVADAHAREAH